MSVIGVVTLSGCTTGASDNSANAEKDTSAHAKLDFLTGEIVLPLDDYDVLASWQDQATIEHAEQVSIGLCMTEKGQPYSAASATETADSSIGDRQYGLWDEERAKQFGYNPAPSAVQVAIAADQKVGGQAWTDALDSCEDSQPKAIVALRPSNDEVNSSIVARLQTQAFNDASADPAWQKARQKWWGCLKDAGLDPRTGASDWSSKQAYDLLAQVDSSGQIKNPEAEIQVAYTEAHCNVQTGLAQTLGNLEAAYQAPLIAKNQAALNKFKVLKQKRLADARQFVAAHG